MKMDDLGVPLFSETPRWNFWGHQNKAPKGDLLKPTKKRDEARKPSGFFFEPKDMLHLKNRIAPLS